MSSATSLVRACGALSAGLLALGMLSACTSASEPKATKTTLFASEEEAFQAAEDTYRAYTDAVNATVLSDPDTIEPVYALLIDPARAASRKNYSIYLAEKITRTGQTKFDSFTPVSFKDGLVTVHVCLDVSDVELTNEQGTSVVPPDRVDRQAIELELVAGKTSTGLSIRSNVIAEGFQC